MVRERSRRHEERAFLAEERREVLLDVLDAPRQAVLVRYWLLGAAEADDLRRRFRRIEVQSVAGKVDGRRDGRFQFRPARMGHRHTEGCGRGPGHTQGIAGVRDRSSGDWRFVVALGRRVLASIRWGR